MQFYCVFLQFYECYSKILKRLVTHVPNEEESVLLKCVTEAAFLTSYSIAIYYLVNILSKVYAEVKIILSLN